MALKFDKPETYFTLFGEGLAIVVAIWLIDLVAGLLSYTAPSVNSMLAAFAPFDFMALLVQVLGTIVLALALNMVIQPLKEQIFGK